MKYIRSVLRKMYLHIAHHDPLEGHIKRGLVVGKNFHMFDEVMIDYGHTWHIQIGDDVTLAPRVNIIAHDASTKKYLNCTRIAKVKIGNRVFVGAGAVILPGVTIGDDVVVGAGSVVTRDVPNGHVVAGNPARILCTVSEFVSRRRAEMETHPYFGEEYTIEKNVTAEMKNEMNVKMKDGIGYVW